MSSGLMVRTMAGRMGSDNLQTPPCAVRPLVLFLPRTLIWECAVGQGQLIEELRAYNFNCIGSDIWPENSEGRVLDFLTDVPDEPFGCIVTNPPYSIKRKFVERAYSLNVPWAFLMPIAVLGTAWMQRLGQKHGLEVILLDRRVNFTGGSGSWFSVAWFTHGLYLGNDLTYARLENE